MVFKGSQDFPAAGFLYTTPLLSPRNHIDMDTLPWPGGPQPPLTWYCGKAEWLPNTCGGGQFKLSQNGWFMEGEVKAVAKRGVKTFPVYLRLFFSAAVTGGLTVSHRRGKSVQWLRQREDRMPPGPSLESSVLRGLVISTPRGSSKSWWVSTIRNIIRSHLACFEGMKTLALLSGLEPLFPPFLVKEAGYQRKQ